MCRKFVCTLAALRGAAGLLFGAHDGGLGRFEGGWDSFVTLAAPTGAAIPATVKHGGEGPKAPGGAVGLLGCAPLLSALAESATGAAAPAFE